MRDSVISTMAVGAKRAWWFASARRGQSPSKIRKLTQKKLIEQAYTLGEGLGLAVWCLDEAGPYATEPYPGARWQPSSRPARYSQKYQPNGTAKILTLFHPHSGQVCIRGVMRCPNYVLHGWTKQTLLDILSMLPSLGPENEVIDQDRWQKWRQGAEYLTLPEALPPLRLLLVMDNLAGHKSKDFVGWLSIQRLLKRRTLDRQTPTTPEQIIQWFQATATAWNADPTPFEWNGKRKRRRRRSSPSRYLLGASGACTRRPLVRRSSRTTNGDVHTD
jgi:hypothetical protein